MSSLSERLRAEGREQGILQGILLGKQEGRQEGRREGRQEGQFTVLQRQLERRFGPLEPHVRVRLQQAQADDLAHWADNILDAATLEDVFKPD